MNKLETVWKKLVNVFETGDLIPLLIIVSAGHYITVLRQYDQGPTAIAVGLLVDLGHFRAVRIASRYRFQRAQDGQKGIGRKSEFILRWATVAVLTIITLSYHLRFYAQDWALAAPIPILIAFLAYCDGRGPRGKRTVDERVEQLRVDLRESQAQSALLALDLRNANQSLTQVTQDLKEVRARPVELHTGSYSDFAQICASHNGDLRSMSGSQLNLLAARGGIVPMPESTIKNWRDKYINLLDLLA